MVSIRTRFAPSPTGSLHIGGARTALFNYLLARSQEGEFYLRIDDTDPSRSSESCTQNIINSLQWLGLQWQGDIIRQSQRTAIYQRVARQLLDNGHAYKSYANPDIEAKVESIKDVSEVNKILRSAPDRNGEPYAIRFKAPLHGHHNFSDINIGNMQSNYSEINDFVLIRQDGTPTYMLASVVDDEAYNITHVVRGMDHISNTKRQIPLIRALNYKIPSYVHVPMINNPDGHKMSKREGAQSIHEYQQLGILPEAMLNYMCLLGWGHPNNEEIISLTEAINKFQLEDLRLSPSCFDMCKLVSINHHYVKKMNNVELMKQLRTLCPDIPERVSLCLDNLKTKAHVLTYITDMASSILTDDMPSINDPLPHLSMYEHTFLKKMNFSEIDFSSIANIQTTLANAIAEANEIYGDISKKNILMFMRICLTGMRTSPGLFDIMYALGADICKQRIERIMVGNFEKPSNKQAS